MDYNQAALSVVNTLVQHRYMAYFAGGWVRDFLLGHPSQDIDIATDATPNQIMQLFPKTVPVGVAFGVVLVVIDGHSFEVATFRRDLGYTNGRKPEAIAHSTPEEDAIRRDFTINGMFYDPIAKKVIDYVGGMQDLKTGIVRAIGDPFERIREDRLRMVRAVRFSACLGFPLDTQTEAAIVAHAQTLLPAVAMERIWQELNKMRASAHFDYALSELHRLGLLQQIFPELQNVSLTQLEERIAHLDRFPSTAPTILFLCELFPEANETVLLQMAERLKVSRQDFKWISYACLGLSLIKRSGKQLARVERIEWAYLYADERWETVLGALLARLPLEEEEELLKLHKEHYFQLWPHIERIRNRQPVVDSRVLKQHGIQPGPEMGKILYATERLAINEDLHDSEAIMKRYKASSAKSAE